MGLIDCSVIGIIIMFGINVFVSDSVLLSIHFISLFCAIPLAYLVQLSCVSFLEEEHSFH